MLRFAVTALLIALIAVIATPSAAQVPGQYITAGGWGSLEVELSEAEQATIRNNLAIAYFHLSKQESGQA